MRLHVSFHRRHRMYTTFIKGQNRVKCNHKSFIHSREKRFKEREQATSIHHRLLYRELGSGKGHELIAIFHRWNNKKKWPANASISTLTVNWTCWRYSPGVFPRGIPQGEIPFCKGRHPLDANSSKLSSVLQSLMAKWQLITFWLYQILIQPTFKNFPSLLSNLPLAGPVDKGALRWGSARDDGKA